MAAVPLRKKKEKEKEKEKEKAKEKEGSEKGRATRITSSGTWDVVPCVGQGRSDSVGRRLGSSALSRVPKVGGTARALLVLVLLTPLILPRGFKGGSREQARFLVCDG